MSHFWPPSTLSPASNYLSQFVTGDGYAMCKQAVAESPANRSISLAPEKEQGKAEGPSEPGQSITGTPPDVPFDWAFFWTLLQPQIHYFLGAVAVSQHKILVVF